MHYGYEKADDPLFCLYGCAIRFVIVLHISDKAHAAGIILHKFNISMIFH